MLKSLVQSLYPTLAMPVDALLRKQLLWMLFLRVVFYTLLLGITFIFNEMEFHFILLPGPLLLLLLTIVYLSSIFSGILIIRSRVPSKQFGVLQSLLDTVFATSLVYFTGISNSIFASVYFFPIIAAGLIFPKRGGFLAAAIATLLFGLMLILEFTGVTPSYFESSHYIPITETSKLINLFAVRGVTFFLAALVSALFGMRLASTEEVLSSTISSFDKLSQLYKTIFDNIATGIITFNNRNEITSANNAALAITGYSLSQLIGAKITSIFPDLELSKNADRRAIDFTKMDGTDIRIGYSLTALNAPQNPLKHPSEFWTDSGLLTLQNISKIEQLERKMRQGEKMAAVGMMSAGIAHDFRNPLAAIYGSAQLLRQDFNQSGQNIPPENIELTDIILRESNKMIETISDFLKFARPDTMKRAWFSLINCIEEVLQVCRADPRWPKSCQIEIKIDRTIDIWADERQFSTVMNHLIQNAIAFCPRGEEILRIEARESRTVNNREQLVISVEDNGPGIKKEMYDKVFEPFYTKRPDGTGLGLSIVKQTIEAHKGHLEISRSELGGAKITLFLPIF